MTFLQVLNTVIIHKLQILWGRRKTSYTFVLLEILLAILTLKYTQLKHNLLHVTEFSNSI